MAKISLVKDLLILALLIAVVALILMGYVNAPPIAAHGRTGYGVSNSGGIQRIAPTSKSYGYHVFPNYSGLPSREAGMWRNIASGCNRIMFVDALGTQCLKDPCPPECF